MRQQINLCNPLFRKQTIYFSAVTMLQGLGLILAGSLLIYGYAVFQVAELGTQLVQSTQRLDAERVRLQQSSAGFSMQQSRQLVQDELIQLEKKNAEASELVETLRAGAVGNDTGYSEYMRAFSRQAVPGLWLTGFKLSGEQISLSGGVIAPELVPDFIQKMGREAVMQGKSFTNLQMQHAKDVNYLEFTLYSAPADEVKP